MKPLRIALVYDVIYPYVKGGAEKRYWEIAKRLARKHEVHLFGMKFWSGKGTIKKKGVFLHGVCRPKKLYNKTGERSISEALYFSFHLMRLLIRERFDVIDCSNFPYFPMFVCKLCSMTNGNPLIATWHEVWGRKYWLSYLGWKGIIGYFVERIASMLPDEIIAVSGSTRDDIGIVFGRKAEVVHNGISLDEIEKIKAKRNKDKIITVGRLIREKNVDRIISAMPEVLKKNRNAYLVIVGNGPERRNLEKLAEQLGLGRHVRFKGFIPNHSALVREIKSSSVFVTQSGREGFGIIAIEALASDTPVIIPKNLSGFPYAKYCAIANDNSLAEKILKPKPANPDSVSSFGWDSIAGEIEKLYKTSVRK